ncbi:META domain-containing protein [Sphingomonas sp.]|uniref:META domain-containing protein n=1 Tax=Sphingomonas sp. TaxID=28214 RepID=UPI002C90D2DD|nr:META domain-containing protein [Sphingomonas sp.]HTG39072.1 META domain-containing protein [Sphingomonas sp.]
MSRAKSHDAGLRRDRREFNLLPMLRTLIPLTLLAACTAMPPVGPPAAAPAAPYRAIGTEPFWSVTLAHGRMRYDDPSGTVIDVTAPTARASLNGERYVTDRLTLDITHAPCSDGMSDRRYPDTVLVIADGRELKGCGMPAADEDALTGQEWRINAVDGAAPPAPRPATLTFAEGRLSGTTGCNRVMGSYSLSDDRLTLDGVATTRMACPGAAMEQEARITEILRGPLSVVRGKDGVMLTGDKGSLTLVPVRP